MEKHITILGSTGSIGTQTLDVVDWNPDLKVTAISGKSNVALLEKQARKYKPGFVAVYDEKNAADLKERLKDTEVKVLSGMEGLIEICTLPEVDIIVGAISGMIGIRPTIEGIRAGKDIAIANKETLVTAGHIIMPLAKEKGVRLLPVDSEHSAIFQCLHGEENKISRILLTASGGPFRGWSKARLESVRPEDALKHPNWSMGAKITIDSSTLINKALEVMEAHWLFGVSYDQIEVLVQPKSIIHSMVEFEDGGIKAQLGTPDMHLPIQYAMFYPERRTLPGKRLDFSEISSIAIEKPDMDVFEGLKIGIECGRRGGNVPTIFNAANEEAVARFLNREIPYPGIVESIKKALEKVPVLENPTLEQVLETESFAREVVR